MTKITHVLSDGTIRDSVEGLVVPAGHPVYRVIEKARKNKKEEKDEEAKGA